MLGNPGFFTIFKTEGPEKLVISSVPVMGPVALETDSKMI